MEERKRERPEQALLAGCSAFSWKTQDGKHLWGRNLDFNRLAEGTKVTYLPRGTQMYTFGTSLEGDLRRDTGMKTAYACLGIGTLLLESTPALYEGINEKGLMGGQLYYRGFASFEQDCRPGRVPLQPPFAVTYFLGTCATVGEVVQKLETAVTLVGTPILGMYPTLHWIFSDRSGESIIVESDEDGLHIYRNTMGVMTNSPSYPWHRTNLLNYVGLRDLDYDALEINGARLEQCFSGSGSVGLPGDWSSPSRFVRLSFLKKYAVKGACEEEGVARMFRLFESVAFPMGMVRVSQPGTVTAHDRNVVPFDYTVYTSIMCAESLTFYWTTYHNATVRYVGLECLMEEGGEACAQFDLGTEAGFIRVEPSGDKTKCRNHS